MDDTTTNQVTGEQRTRSGAASRFGAAHGYVPLDSERPVESGESSGLVGVGGVFESVRAKAPYSIIYADPPWMYNGNLYDGRGHAAGHYCTQKPDEIARLPVGEIAAWDSVCFMWATYPRLPEALYVMRAWGYEYKTVAFTWVKINPTTKRHYFGMGQYTRANAEICLLGTRGNAPERKDKGVPQLLECNVSDHSRKPDEARDRIVRLYGDIPRLEMFARHDPTDIVSRFDGWTIWGNETDGRKL